jgi:hypothetical protein
MMKFGRLSILATTLLLIVDNFGVEYNLLSGTLPVNKTCFGLHTKHKFPNALSSTE